MKKLLTLCAFFLFASVSFAQDTIRWGNPRYYWDHLMNVDSVGSDTLQYYLHNPGDCLGTSTLHDMIQTAYSKTIEIYGLAYLVPTSRYSNISWGVDSFYVHIYQQQNGVISLLDSVQYTRDMVRINRGRPQLLKYRNYDDYWEFRGEEWLVDTLLEIYFDQPVTVHDTFWFGDFVKAENKFYTPVPNDRPIPRSEKGGVARRWMPTNPYAWCPPEEWAFQGPDCRPNIPPLLPHPGAA